MSEPNENRIRVLIVDDYVLLREALCALLNREADFAVVGSTGTPAAARTLAKALQPDLVLVNLVFRTGNGLDLAKQLQLDCPTTRIVIFTGVDDEQLRLDAIRIGVHGYLQKTFSVSEVLAALRVVQQGERVVGEPHAATPGLHEMTRLTTEQTFAGLGLHAQEIEIMRLASQGYSNREIGSHLLWGELTVKHKMQGIYRKLQVRDRAQMVAEAIRLGLI